MKNGTVLKINHKVYGTYALVLSSDKDYTKITFANGWEASFDKKKINTFQQIGKIIVDKQYSMLGNKFRKCYLNKERFDVRVNDDDGCIETRVGEIRLMVFKQWTENTDTKLNHQTDRGSG